MSNTLEGVEIFDEGTWNGLPFNSDDLNGITDAFNALGLSGRVPLKFGHTGKDPRAANTGDPALGWVSKIYRKGTKLVADFTDIPTVVYDAIKKGLYKFVSIELLKNVPANTRKIPWVLDSVALLGATQPAVGSLKDLQALTMTRGTGLQCSERVTFARAGEIHIKSQEKKVMADENSNANAIEVLTKQINELVVKNGDLVAELGRLKARDAEGVQFKARFERLQDEVNKNKIDSHRALIKSALETAVKAEEILPAARERFIRTYRVDEDEPLMAITMQDVHEFIEENPNPRPSKKAQKRATFSLQDPEGTVPEGTRPDHEADMRARASLAKKGIHTPTWQQYEAEVKAVFTANRELGDAWKYQLDNRSAS